MPRSASRLLIVKSEATSAHTLRALFEDRGWQVVVARTLAEALPALGWRPHLILLEARPSDGPGEQVLRYVRDSGLPTCVAIASDTPGQPPDEPWLELRPDLLVPRLDDFARLLQAYLGPDDARSAGPNCLLVV